MKKLRLSQPSFEENGTLKLSQIGERVNERGLAKLPRDEEYMPSCAALAFRGEAHY